MYGSSPYVARSQNPIEKMDSSVRVRAVASRRLLVALLSAFSLAIMLVVVQPDQRVEEAPYRPIKAATTPAFDIRKGRGRSAEMTAAGRIAGGSSPLSATERKAWSTRMPPADPEAAKSVRRIKHLRKMKLQRIRAAVAHARRTG